MRQGYTGIRQHRAYFQTREVAIRFFQAVKKARPWPSIVAWNEMPTTKGFAVIWYD